MDSHPDWYLDLIFAKATPISGRPGYAIDCDYSTICRWEYGLYTEHGWQVDHAVPVAIGGFDLFANHRPRHWRGNSLAGGLLGGAISGLGGLGR